MADVAKRRSVLIFNIPLSTSAAELETFLHRELELSNQDRGHLLRVLFPVSSSSPQVALATFQEEKAMVALMRKRLLFEGEHITMQTFVSQVFSFMTALVNPNITELLPFHSSRFSRLLEKRSGVECHQVDEQNRGMPVSKSSSSSQGPYMLTGNWHQLQYARKLMQEWVVDEANQLRYADKGPGNQGEGTLVASSSPEENAPQETVAIPDSAHGIDQIGSLEKRTSHRGKAMLSNDLGSRPVQKSQSAVDGAGSFIERTKERVVVDENRDGARKGSNERSNCREEGHPNNLACSVEGLSGRPVDSSSDKGVRVDGSGSRIERVHHEQSSSLSSRVPRDRDVLNDVALPASFLQQKEPSKSLHRSSQNVDECQNQERGTSPLALGEGFLDETTVYSNSHGKEQPASVEGRRRAHGNGQREIASSRTGDAGPFSFVSSLKSEDELSVGSTLDYMKYVKVPQTPLTSHDQAVASPSLSGNNSQANGQTTERDGDLETDFGGDQPPSLTLTRGKISKGEESLGSLGSLPVDPGVFSYILLKQSDSIREIEEKFGVKFSMHIARDIEDTDVESALLRITPTVEMAAVEQAHEEFVNFYSHIFSTLKHRDITIAETSINPEALDKTLELIHGLYTSVLLTVSHKKVLIYGPNESDVRIAKSLIIEALKEKPADLLVPQGQTEIKSHIGEFSPDSESVDSPSVKPHSETEPRQDLTKTTQAEYSFSKRENDGSSREPRANDLSQAQTNPPGLKPSSGDHERGLCSSANLEVGSGMQAQIRRQGLEHITADRRLNGPSAESENETLDYRGMGGLRRKCSRESNLSSSLHSDPIKPTSTNEVRVVDSGTKESDRQHLSYDIIPVDPGVFTFIQAQKHTILCDIEHNYGVKFSVKGNVESDVYMVEVVPQGAASEKDTQRGKEAFVDFYSEVFSGLDHRVISLEDYQDVSQGALLELIQEMEHSFSDILFRVAGSKVLIYGQGRHNVESAKDLVLIRLCRNLTLSPDSAMQHDDDMSLESLGSDALVNRLNYLRYGSLSPDEALRGQMVALPHSTDSEALRRESAEERIDEKTNDLNLKEETTLQSRSPQHQLPMSESQQMHYERESRSSQHQLPMSESQQMHNERHEQLGSSQFHGSIQSSGAPSETSAKNVRQASDASPHMDDVISVEDDKIINGKTGETRYTFLNECLIVDLASGLHIQVYCRDITELQVDAVVNAANERLSNIAGVAGAIRRAAGKVMQGECNTYIAHHGLLYPAKVVHTSAGRLPCKFVLHAVGPQWGDYPNRQQCRETLKATVLRCFQLADEKLQVTSLAMPFISSGIFGVPLEICIEEICKALLDFDKRRLASLHGILQQVHFVDKDSTNIRLAQDIMIKILCPKAGGSDAGVEEAPSAPTAASLTAETDMAEISWEHGKIQDGDFAAAAAAADDDDEVAPKRRGHMQRGASAISTRSQRRKSSSSEEDVPHESVGYMRMDDYSMTSGRSAMMRSTSLPYLARDDSDDPGRTSWAYRTSTLPGCESKGLNSGKKSSHARERGWESEHASRTAKVSTKETRQEEKVRELIDACSRESLSPELSRKTEYELNRIFTEQERGARGKQPRPKRRAQSLDRRPRDKCFVCSSTTHLSKRKSCEHMICEICKQARLDVGRCKQCVRAKGSKIPEKRCDLCFSSTLNFLLTCRDCDNSVCIKCIQKGMDKCQDCMDRSHSSPPEGPTEKRQPKLREPIVATRSSRIDNKKGYRVKPGISDAAGTRRKPMLGLNQPIDIDVQAYSRGAGVSGAAVSKSGTGRQAFSKEFVTEEAPHEEILRRLTREQEARPQIIPKEDVSRHSSSVHQSQTNRRHSRKRDKTEDLQVVGQASAPVSQQELMMTCVICMDRIKDPKTLDKCKHIFCSACIDKSLQFKPVCPICGLSYGQLRGNQPPGSMQYYTTVSSDLPGHPGCGTIIITYVFSNGIQSAEHPNPGVFYHGTKREAYLPNSQEGREVLQLLLRAFDAKLLFTIDRSVTTGQDNTVVWNDVHHKTRQTGGAEHHGYPDPGYLRRVKEELATKGIK